MVINLSCVSPVGIAKPALRHWILSLDIILILIWIEGKGKSWHPTSSKSDRQQILAVLPGKKILTPFALKKTQWEQHL